jgi:regulatory protein
MEEYNDALKYAFRRLAMKSQPTTELIQHLRLRQFSEEIIEKVITKCSQLGYLNDAQWLENYTRRLSEKGNGPRAIFLKLKSKGIDAKSAEKAIQQHFHKMHIPDQIKALFEKKYRSKDLNDPKSRNQVVGSLLRKGFSLEDIKNALP